MSLTKPERRQRIRFRIRKRLVVLLQIKDYLYLEVTKKFMLNLMINGLLFWLLQEKRNRKGTNVDVAIAVGKLVAESVKSWDRSCNIRLLISRSY
jgi:large subunit ribosomal protein L18